MKGGLQGGGGRAHQKEMKGDLKIYPWKSNGINLAQFRSQGLTCLLAVM